MIPAKIVAFRTLLNLTQAELAALLGTSARSVARWEADMSGPGIDPTQDQVGMMSVIEKSLGIDPTLAERVKGDLIVEGPIRARYLAMRPFMEKK